MPVFNRIALVVGGLFVTGSSLIVLLIDRQRLDGRQTFSSALMILTGALLAGFGAFAYRRKTNPMAPGADLSGEGDEPVKTPGQVISDEVGLTGQPKRVVADLENSWVRFEFCHYPHNFFATVDRTMTCGFTEILAFSEISRRDGPYLLIITTRGRARVNGWAEGYHTLKACFETLGLPNLAGPEIETPPMMHAVICGVLTGCILGWWSAPIQEPDGVFAVRMITGGCLGALALFAVVLAGERWLKIRLALPLLAGFIGAVASGLVGLLLVSLIPRDLMVNLIGLANGPVVAAVTAGTLGGLGGFAVGHWINQSRFRRPDRKPVPKRDPDWS